jgi:hypothetical protein
MNYNVNKTKNKLAEFYVKKVVKHGKNIPKLSPSMDCNYGGLLLGSPNIIYI